MSKVSKTSRAAKPTLGFRWYECAQSPGGFRHGQLSLYPLTTRDLDRELVDAVRSGTEWRIKRATELVQLADGAKLFQADDYVTMGWQASADFNYWYACSLNIQFGERFGTPELLALQKRIIKAADKLQMESSPAEWARALGAVPIERLKDSAKGSLSTLGLFTLAAEWPADDATLYGPSGKPAATAAEGVAA